MPANFADTSWATEQLVAAGIPKFARTEHLVELVAESRYDPSAVRRLVGERKALLDRPDIGSRPQTVAEIVDGIAAGR